MMPWVAINVKKKAIIIFNLLYTKQVSPIWKLNDTLSYPEKTQNKK